MDPAFLAAIGAMKENVFMPRGPAREGKSALAISLLLLASRPKKE